MENILTLNMGYSYSFDMIYTASIFWDPNPEVFTVPFINMPILWYGLFFAAGFMLGFPIFVGILERFFIQRPDFEERELIEEIDLSWLKEPAQRGKGAVVNLLNEWLGEPKEMIEVNLSQKKSLLALCSLHAQAALRRLKLEELFPKAILSLQRQAVQVTDRLTVYMVIATILGARVGHYLFYEKPSDYFHNLSELFVVWKMRGLSSHGAAIAIVLGLGLFAYRYRLTLRGLSWLRLLDFVCVPTALAGAFIRLGNFFNQEILGIPSTVPWAVIFGHPADGSYPTARHPVQLYESFAYAIVFLILWRLTYSSKYLLEKGKLLAIFLVLVFGFRFFVEYWKEEQSLIMPNFFHLTMGQVLSVPAVLVGLFLMAWSISRR
jgi:phosphatidylglycerol---prolipoprotein diacylglyceryl transferase